MDILSNLFLSKKNQMTTSGKEKWLIRFDQIIEKHLNTVSLKNEKLAQDLGISERQLFRKVKELSNMSPQKYLRKYRLHQAMKFLKSGKHLTVKETSYAVGFLKVSYFISKFEKEFGKRPLQVLKESGWR